jgi:hypothetical protein
MMKATFEVLSDTELLEQIRESRKDFKEGRFKKLRDLIKDMTWRGACGRGYEREPNYVG